MKLKEVKVAISLWQAIKDVWAGAWGEFVANWKPLWEQYKTIIGPFIKGTFSYAWAIISGFITIISKGLYGTGKCVLDWLIALIKKA